VIMKHSSSHNLTEDSRALWLRKVREDVVMTLFEDSNREIRKRER